MDAMDSVSTCSKCAPGDAQSPYGRRARGTPDDGRTQTIRSLYEAPAV